MAVNESRSLNAELAEGLSDGGIFKLAPDRGGDIEYSNIQARNALLAADFHGNFATAHPQAYAARQSTLHG